MYKGSLEYYIHMFVCVCVCIYVYMHACMDGWMDVCVYFSHTMLIGVGYF